MRRALAHALFVSAVAALAGCSSETSSPPRPTTSSTPTFRRDVHPLLRSSCALPQCHGTTANNLGLFVPEDPAAAYLELQKDSPTANGAKLVVAADPAASFLMSKMDGDQASFQDKCLLPGCGDRMPPAGTLGGAQRDIVRAWIQAGAKDD